MKRYFVDTSVIIDYLRNKSQAVQIIESLEGELTSSYVCLAELYEGVERVTKGRKKIEIGLNQFFSSLSYVHGLDKDIVKSFGKVRAQLKKSGKVIEDIDIFIAATCISKGEILVTFNIEHFKRVPELTLFDLN